MRAGGRPADDQVQALDRSRVRAGLVGGLFGRTTAPPRIGRFEIRRKLGEGASGVVFAAYDPDLARDVAVKLLVRGMRDPDSVFTEARTLAALNHPNVLAAYDVGLADGVPYVVSELATGGNLREFLALGQDRAIRWSVLRDVLSGVAEAHERGIVHRDLKPENVFVGAGRARVGDFGLAGSMGLGGAGGGSPVGTPAYMAPEVQRGQRNDPRSDQYALGVMAFELLFDRHPFGGAGFHPDHVPRLESFPAAERPLAAVVLRAMAEHDADRHPSVRAFAAALEAVLGAGRARTRGLRLALGVAAALAASATVAFLVARRTGMPGPEQAALEARARADTEERDLIAEMGALSRAQRFAECADTLSRRANTEALRRFWVACAERASLDHLDRACAAITAQAPTLALAECDGPAREARHLEAAGDADGCVRRLRDEPPTMQRMLALGRCRMAAPASMGPRDYCRYVARYQGQPEATCDAVSE